MAGMRHHQVFAVIFLPLFLFLLAGHSAAWAQEGKAPALIRVPVYFITDRNLVSDTPEQGAVFGPHRKYIGDCKHDPYMGLAWCVIKNTDGKQITPALAQLGWAPVEGREREGASKATLITASDFPTIESKFYDRVRADALKTEHKDIIMFAHGYKNGFESAMKTASRFSYTFEEPTILYSWPSVDKLRSYSSDENNNEWSQEHFVEQMQRIEPVSTADPPVNLRIYAHSMGSRLVVRGAPFLREKPFVKECALVCPDIDEGLVRHYAHRYLSTKATVILRLYMSQHDKALAFSQIIHGGYNRLGECADSLASLGKQALSVIPGAQAAEAATTDDSQKEIDDVAAKLKKRLQTIDFTVLDHGMIGHKIPVGLIHSMAYTETPGPGLEFLTQGSGERSRTSRMISRMTHTKLTGDGWVGDDNCLRVAETEKNKKDIKAAQ